MLLLQSKLFYAAFNVLTLSVGQRKRISGLWNTKYWYYGAGDL